MSKGKPLSQEQIDAIKQKVIGQYHEQTEPRAMQDDGPDDEANPTPEPKPEQRPLGYKSPPQATRFKKGQSGNPKGRPKRSAAKHSRGYPDLNSKPTGLTPSEALFAEEGKRLVPIKENGKTSHIPVGQAAMRGTYTAAAKGRPLSQKIALERQQAIEEKQREQCMYHNALWAAVKDQNADILRRIEAGEELPDPLPHPDDIVISEDHDPKFLGPLDEEGARELTERLALRDHLVLEHIYEEAYGPHYPAEVERLQAYREATDAFAAYLALEGEEEDNSSPRSTGARMLIAFIETLLSPRLRWSTVDWMMADMKANRDNRTRRALEKALTKGRKRHQLPFRRGQAFVPAAAIVDMMKFANDSMTLHREADQQAIDAANAAGRHVEDVKSPPLDPYVLTQLLKDRNLVPGRLKQSQKHGERDEPDQAA